MACPFAAVATLSGILVGCKLLLFRDKYRFLAWVGIGIATLGWILYAPLGRPIALRMALELETMALLIGMVARIIYLARYHRQAIEVPGFLRILLRFFRPFALHPTTLVLKGVLLLLLLVEAAGLYNVPAGLTLGAAASLVGWISLQILWHSRQRSAET